MDKLKKKLRLLETSVRNFFSLFNILGSYNSKLISSLKKGINLPYFRQNLKVNLQIVEYEVFNAVIQVSCFVGNPVHYAYFKLIIKTFPF